VPKYVKGAELNKRIEIFKLTLIYSNSVLVFNYPYIVSYVEEAKIILSEPSPTWSQTGNILFLSLEKDSC